MALEDGLGYRAVDARIVLEPPGTKRALSDRPDVPAGVQPFVARERYPGEEAA
jgi:hypothetical protein